MSNSHLPPALLPFLNWFAPPAQEQELPAEPPLPDELEQQRVQADLDYLNSQQQRDARRVQEASALERAIVDRTGWQL